MKKPVSKIFFFLLVFIYVFSNVGICVVSHYCGGNLENVSLFSKSNSCCSGEEDNDMSGCCKNDSKHVAFKKDFTFFTIVSDCKVSVQQLFILDHASLINFSFNTIADHHFLAHKKNHPPNLVHEDIVSNSVLRI